MYVTHGFDLRSDVGCPRPGNYKRHLSGERGLHLVRWIGTSSAQDPGLLEKLANRIYGLYLHRAHVAILE